jgi:hypothetical protein
MAMPKLSTPPSNISGPFRIKHLRNIALGVLAVLLVPQSGVAAVVGVVTVSDGENHFIREGGYYDVVKGVDIEEGDIIQTAANGAVQVEMDDGSLLDIGESSEFYIDEYVLADDASVETATVSLVKGWLRFVTSKLRRTGRYEINMPVATIGIRGTEGILSTDAQTSSILLNEGNVEVFELNESGELGTARKVSAGEFVQREKGKRLERRRGAPERFAKRMPKRFKARPKKFKSTLSKRGVKPKKKRQARDEDFRGVLGTNPRINKKLKRRGEKKAEQSGKDRGSKSRSNTNKASKKKGGANSSAKKGNKPKGKSRRK